MNEAFSKSLAGVEYLSARLVLVAAAVVLVLAFYVWLDVADSILADAPHSQDVSEPPLEQGPPTIPEGEVFRY